MAVLKKNGPVYESVSLMNTLAMTRRDLYQIYLGFESESYCYIIREDDEGKLPLVYSRTVSPGDSITLPGEGRDFLAGEHPGTNRLYVIVSAQPRQNLGRLIEQRERGSSAGSLERSILSEVLAVKRYASSAQEIPVIFSPPQEGDPVMNGEMTIIEGRDVRVFTITVRVQ